MTCKSCLVSCKQRYAKIVKAKMTHRAYLIKDSDFEDEIISDFMRNKLSPGFLQNKKKLRDSVQDFFGRRTFSVGRFGDGSYPVFYSASSERTALREVCNYLYSSMDVKKLTTPIHIDIVTISLNGKCLDISQNCKADPLLVHPKSSYYYRCHELASNARKQGFDYLKSQSARDIRGTCYATFNDAIIEDHEDDEIYTLQPIGGRFRTKIKNKNFLVNIDDVYTHCSNL